MKTIVEVGAHTGEETRHFLEDPDARVFAFEPDQVLFQPLFIVSTICPNLTALPFAVDIGDNQEPFFHFPDGQSTLQPTEFGRAVYTMTWTIRLDTFMRLYSVHKIDYLRIDAPWREEMCLESLAERIDNVESGRVRQYDSRTDIAVWLQDHGFLTQLDINAARPSEPDIRFWRK